MKYNVAFFVLFCLLSFLHADTIVTNKTTMKDVTITQETFKKVKYYYNNIGSTSKQECDRTKVTILEITYSKLPIEMKNGNTYFENGSYEQAIQSYKSLEQNKKTIMRQHCLYKSGLCFMQLGKYTDAIKIFQALLKNIPDTYYKADVAYQLGICFMEKEEFDKAYGQFQDAMKYYEEINLIEQKNEARVLLAKSLDKANKLSEAITVYEQLLFATKTVAIRKNIQVNLGNCYLKLEQYPKAQKIFLECLKTLNAKEKQHLANIYLGLGKCLFQEQKVEDALLCYLRVIIMYEPNYQIGREAYERAIYCFTLLKDKKPEYAQRAVELRTELEQKFPKQMTSEPKKKNSK